MCHGLLCPLLFVSFTTDVINCRCIQEDPFRLCLFIPVLNYRRMNITAKEIWIRQTSHFIFFNSHVGCSESKAEMLGLDSPSSKKWIMPQRRTWGTSWWDESFEHLFKNWKSKFQTPKNEWCPKEEPRGHSGESRQSWNISFPQIVEHVTRKKRLAWYCTY